GAAAQAVRHGESTPAAAKNTVDDRQPQPAPARLGAEKWLGKQAFQCFRRESAARVGDLELDELRRLSAAVELSAIALRQLGRARRECDRASGWQGIARVLQDLPKHLVQRLAFHGDGGDRTSDVATSVPSCWAFVGGALLFLGNRLAQGAAFSNCRPAPAEPAQRLHEFDALLSGPADLHGEPVKRRAYVGNREAQLAEAENSR